MLKIDTFYSVFSHKAIFFGEDAWKMDERWLYETSVTPSVVTLLRMPYIIDYTRLHNRKETSVKKQQWWSKLLLASQFPDPR